MRVAVFPWLALGLALTTSGCVRPFTQQPFDATPGFGEAVNQNAAVMIVDPEPHRARDTLVNLEGNRALIAITRYQTDTTIPPQTQNTTAGVGGGSSGQ